MCQVILSTREKLDIVVNKWHSMKQNLNLCHPFKFWRDQLKAKFQKDFNFPRLVPELICLWHIQAKWFAIHLGKIFEIMTWPFYLISGRAKHDNSRPDSQWWHRHHSDNHPIRTGVSWIHSQYQAFIVRNSLEDFVHPVSCQDNFLFLGILICIFPFSNQL